MPGRKTITGISAATLGAGALAVLLVTQESPEPRAQPASAESVEWVCTEYGDRVERLFAALDLDLDGLARVRDAIAVQDWPRACNELLAYYRSGTSGKWLRRTQVAHSNERDERADKAARGVFEFYSVEAEVGRSGDGALDWTSDGGTGDPEWKRALHRHAPLDELRAGYDRTGNPEYITQLSADLVDWIVAYPYPGERGHKPQWGGLEVTTRARLWARTFYRLQDEDAFTPAARLLLLSSLPDHAHFLRHYHREKNWTSGQLTGLATIAVAWPEFTESGEWLDYASGVMTAEMDGEVYPDGAQTELTSYYHQVITGDFEVFASLLEKARHPAHTGSSATVERMWEYTAWTMRPDGHGPLNNNSDRHPTRDPVVAAAKRFERPEWIYIASNGAEGVAPAGSASKVLPWAGHVVMRSGFDADAHWAFFDVGPWGMAHQHDDKLHLSVAAFGRDLLVDAGRYSYSVSPLQEFFLRSQSHNVVLIDGSGQNPQEKRAQQPLAADDVVIEDAFDFARGTFDAGFRGVDGEVTHTRAVLYVRGLLWIVADRVATDRPRDVTTLWHFHPDCSVAIDGDDFVTTDAGKGNLRVVPLGSTRWTAEIVSGREKPDVQGWYSPRYNQKRANPVAVCDTRIERTSNFVWLLVPGRGEVPAVRGSIVSSDGDGVRVRVEPPGGGSFTAFVPLAGGTPTLER